MSAWVAERVTFSTRKVGTVTITPVRTAVVGRPVNPWSGLRDGPNRLPLPSPAAVVPKTSNSTTTRHLTVGRQQFRVDVRAGDGTGTPLLMCGGIGTSFEVLQSLVGALDPGIDIIRFDAPGVGGSPVGALPYGFPQLSWMLARMLDEMGYHQVEVLGFSWGGALAQQFAVQHAGRCRRLVLISSSTGVLSVPGAPWLFAKMATPHGFRDNAMAMMAGSMNGGQSRARTDDVGRLFGDTLVVSGRGYLYQLAAAASWTSLPFLTLIRQPVLVMGGEHDPIIPVTNARILAALLPNSTLYVYPAAMSNHSPRPPTSGRGS